jgi:hypothetical protein
MQSTFKVSAILAVALFASSTGVLAQTGEFASIPPGSVVHAGYGLQDWLQSLRNGTPEPPPPAVEAVQAPIILVPPQPEPVPAKPKKTAKKATASAQAQPKQPQ